MTAAAFGPTSCPSGLVPKSKLLHSPEAQSGFVPKLSLHGGKNLALRAEKPISAMRRAHFYSKEPRNIGNNIPKFPDSLDQEISRSFFSGAQRNGVFASDDVLRCEAMCDDIVACAGACSQTQSYDISTKARRAKTSAEGFLRFLLITET